MGSFPLTASIRHLLLLIATVSMPLFGEELSLEEAVSASIANNELPRAATERADAAEARVRRARAFFFPTIGADSTYTRRAFETLRNDGDTTVASQKRDALNARASATQVLLDLRAFPVYSQTKSDRDAARLEASEVTRSVAFEASAAFLQTLGLGQVRQSAERRMALTAQSLADSQARFDAQIVGSNDVTRAELEVATAERELIRSKNAEHEALLNLGFLIGVPVESIATPDNSVLQSLSEEQKSVDELVTAAIQRRLDLAASGKRIEALQLFAKEPLYRYAPAFNLTGEYKYNNEAGFAGKTTTWAVSVSGVWTLFDGFARQADRQERLSLARAAELEREQRVRKVSVEIKTALSALETARAAIELATVAQAAARKNTSETTELYRNGLSTAFAVADSTQRLFEAEVALTREKLTLALAALDLRSALGFDPFGRETK